MGAKIIIELETGSKLKKVENIFRIKRSSILFGKSA